MRLGKIEEDVVDIFQEIFDDFSELEFQFNAINPGHFQMTSRRIDRSFISDLKKVNELVRSKALKYGKKLEPYLEEASDRLGDIGYRCTFNPNENVRLVDKFSPAYIIQINCYELDKGKAMKEWVDKKIKSFNEMHEIGQFINIPKNPITKEELEEIEVIMIDLQDKFDYLDFKIKVHKDSAVPGLLSLESPLIDCRDIHPSEITNRVYDIEEYLKHDGEILDRMQEIGFKYDLTQYSHARYHVYFSRI